MTMGTHVCVCVVLSQEFVDGGFERPTDRDYQPVYDNLAIAPDTASLPAQCFQCLWYGVALRRFNLPHASSADAGKCTAQPLDQSRTIKATNSTHQHPEWKIGRHIQLQKRQSFWAGAWLSSQTVARGSSRSLGWCVRKRGRLRQRAEKSIVRGNMSRCGAVQCSASSVQQRSRVQVSKRPNDGEKRRKEE